jgi:hypothetical protein
MPDGVWIQSDSQQPTGNWTWGANSTLTVPGTLNVTGTLIDTGSTLVSPAITGTVTGGATYTAPTFTTPTLGVATATSLNKLTLTAPATTATLTLIEGTTTTGPAATGTLVTEAGAATLTTKTITAPILTDVKILAANATYSATVTPATLTGFSWTVVAGTYVFELNMPTTMTTNGGLTINFLLTTAVLTSIQYQSYTATADDGGTAVSTNGTTTTSGTKVFDNKTAAYTHVNVKGSMVVGTGGTFAWQGCQNTSAGAGDATIVAIGSYATLTRAS